jgi:rhomboid protease GluP
MDPTLSPLETILRQCAATAPQPWYPSIYAHDAGISRDELDPHLDRLRLGGLIHLTDWVSGQGQGYALTPAGVQLLESPRQLAQLQAGKLPRSEGPSFSAIFAAGKRERTPWSRGEEVREVFLYPRRAVVTQVLLALNVLVFFVGFCLSIVEHGSGTNFLYRGDGRILHQTGSVQGMDLLRGEWWRLLTSCFNHGNLLHIIMNMVVLYIEGTAVERMYGHARYLVLYLLSGVAGSTVALLAQPVRGCVGASGALCGVIAAEGVWLLLNRSHLDARLVSQLLRRLGGMVVMIVLISMMPEVSGGGHFGGAVGGLIAGMLLHYLHLAHGWRRGLFAAALLAMPVVCIALFAPAQKQDQRWEEAELIGRYLPLVVEAEDEVIALDKERVQPVKGQKAEERKAKDVEEALAALAKMRQRLAETLEVLAKAGPYRSPDTEEQLQELRAGLRHNQTTCEALELLRFHLPRSELTMKEAEQYCNKEVLPLLNSRPAARDKAKSAAAATGLEGEQTKLLQEAERFKAVGPYQDSTLEEIRQREMQHLEAVAQWFHFYEECLRKGEVCTEANNPALKRQKERVMKLRQRLNQLLQSTQAKD